MLEVKYAFLMSSSSPKFTKKKLSGKIHIKLDIAKWYFATYFENGLV